jgi:hypothetical protein
MARNASPVEATSTCVFALQPSPRMASNSTSHANDAHKVWTCAGRRRGRPDRLVIYRIRRIFDFEIDVKHPKSEAGGFHVVTCRSSTAIPTTCVFERPLGADVADRTGLPSAAFRKEVCLSERPSEMTSMILRPRVFEPSILKAEGVILAKGVASACQSWLGSRVPLAMSVVVDKLRPVLSVRELASVALPRRDIV